MRTPQQIFEGPWTKPHIGCIDDRRLIIRAPMMAGQTGDEDYWRTVVSIPEDEKEFAEAAVFIPDVFKAARKLLDAVKEKSFSQPESYDERVAMDELEEAFRKTKFIEQQ